MHRLYTYKGFEYLWILVSTGGPGTNAPVDTKGWLYVITGGSGLLALEVRKALRIHGEKEFLMDAMSTPGGRKSGVFLVSVKPNNRNCYNLPKPMAASHQFICPCLIK